MRKITDKEYEELKKKIIEYDINNPVLDEDLHCPLFPKVDVKKVCEMTGWYPHPVQQYILKRMTRFSILNLGRQLGKSDLAAFTLILALMSKDNGEYMIVSIDHSATQIIVDKLMSMIFNHKEHFKLMKKDNILHFKPTNSKVYLKSGTNPDSLVGRSLDGAYLDEAVYLNPDIIDQKIPATITVKRGFIVYTSTPLTENDRFYELYKLGQREENDADYDSDYISFKFTSYDSPYQDPKFLDKEKKNKPEAVFKQQYLAEPMSDAGTVYKNIRENAIGKFKEPEPGRMRYIIGWDIASLNDYSVITVLDRTDNNLVHLNRFTGMDWAEQIDLVIDTCLKYNNAPIFMDASVSGGPVLEFLNNRIYERGLSLYVQGITQTVKTKPKLVQDLAIAMEQNQIKYPPEPIILKEFEDYQAFTSESTGHIKYRAKRQSTDDVVSSMQLMWHGSQLLGTYDKDMYDEENSGDIRTRKNYRSIY